MICELVDKLRKKNVILIDEHTSKMCSMDSKVALEKVVVIKRSTSTEIEEQQQQQTVTREIHGLKRCAHIHVIEEGEM